MSASENILTPEILELLYKERLEDARILYQAKRYAGAFYLCGYVIEFWLKKTIYETLKIGL